jgi:hypothetical protein
MTYMTKYVIMHIKGNMSHIHQTKKNASGTLQTCVQEVHGLNISHVTNSEVFRFSSIYLRHVLD